MKGEVDFGINKVDEALQFLEFGGSTKKGGPNMGFNKKGKEVEGGVGLDGFLKCDQEVGWTGLGPGPEVTQKGILGARSRVCLEGESSATGAMAARGMSGKEKQSILGIYEWSRKTTQVAEPPGVLGSVSPVECKVIGVLTSCGIEVSPMKVIGRSGLDSGDRGELLEADNSMYVHSPIDLAIISGSASSLKAAWFPGVFVRDSLSSSILGKHLSVPSLVMDD
ncbi:hypothetical protein FH972_019699 [Carpinus fangiana]|uniref:Uncharacterized protein n=1 Tax=Carpinus fangiana TaxID=176857 RepID=A0A5N6RRH9_9ROSI|nr:hypothetical protein FH972_019699 [Carpinus fangiana]